MIIGSIPYLLIDDYIAASIASKTHDYRDKMYYTATVNAAVASEKAVINSLNGLPLAPGFNFYADALTSIVKEMILRAFKMKYPDLPLPKLEKYEEKGAFEEIAELIYTKLTNELKRGYDRDSMDRIVAQLLAEMDGIAALENVVVIGATNRPDMLDPALLRPGRFDRIIYVPPPDKVSRFEILKVHTRNVPLAKDVDLWRLAEMLEYYTGADIELLVREAALTALREDPNATEVTMEDFSKAMSKIRATLTPEMIKFYESWWDRFKTSQVRAREQRKAEIFI